MPKKMHLADLGVTSATDLCVLDPNPPPLNFTKDLNLPEHPVSVTPQYQSPQLDTFTYWQPGGPL